MGITWNNAVTTMWSGINNYYFTTSNTKQLVKLYYLKSIDWPKKLYTSNIFNN